MEFNIEDLIERARSALVSGRVGLATLYISEALARLGSETPSPLSPVDAQAKTDGST